MKFKNWIDFPLYSNTFISLCAAAITAETYLLIHAEINWAYISFVFFSTLFLYDFPSLYFAEEAFSVNHSERHKWILENRNTLMLFSAISFVIIAITVFIFPLKFILFMIPNVVVAFAYFFPQTRLRSITGLKATIVAFVWVMTTAFYPLLLNAITNSEANGVFSHNNLSLLTERFLFLLPLSIIFNMRDVEADRIASIKTIPVVYGKKITIIICLISLLLFSVLVFFNRGISIMGIFLTASAIASAGLILRSSSENDEYFYSFWIDGMILLQFLLVITAVILK